MLAIKRIMGYICRWYTFLCKKSLSDAEMAKDVVESFLGGDLTAGDVGEMVEGEAEVFGEEVTGEVGVEAFEDTEEGSMGA